MNLGDVPANSTLYIPFASYDSNGASVTMSGFAVTDIEIYKDGSTTQRASDNGVALLDTDGTDFDTLTGIHGFSIDLSDNTTAGFYAVGSQYWVIVSSVTVSGQTVNFIAARFRIVAAEAVAGKPKADVDAFGGVAGTFAGGRPEVNTTHAAGTAWNSGAIAAATLAADAITAAKVADGTIDAATFAAGAINAAAIATDAITAAKIAADAIGASELAADAVTEIQSGLATSAALATVQADTDDIQTRLPAALVSGRIDASVGAMAANVLTATAINADAITAAKVAADVSAEIADAIWDELLSGHVIAGSAGASLQAAGAAGDPWSTLIPGAYGAGTAGFILGTNVNATISSRASQISVDDVPTNAELATALGTADDAVLAQVALVKAKTDNLPPDPADASDIAGAFAVVNGNIPGVAAIADAVWDEAMAGHVGSGSAGEFQANTPTSAQIVSGILAAEITELISVPGANPQLEEAIAFLYMAVRNARHTTAVADEIHNSGGTVIATATLSDDATTFIKGKYA